MGGVEALLETPVFRKSDCSQTSDYPGRDTVFGAAASGGQTDSSESVPWNLSGWNRFWVLFVGQDLFLFFFFLGGWGEFFFQSAVDVQR